MIRLDKYSLGNLIFFGFLLLVKCLPVWSGAPNSNITSLNASSTLNVNDTLVSKPLGHFELGIFPYTETPGSNYLCIRYKLPIEQTVTWVANRDNPVSDTSTLQFSNDGNLMLIDPQNNKDSQIWSTKAGGPAAIARLLDTGNLVLEDKNGVKIWNSFNDSSPTDTLLPGQRMYRNQNNKLISWQKNRSPATASGSYSFGWENDILALTWTMPKTFLSWKGGSYIPARDVHDAHTISDVEFVYFHETLGHLYISSEPSNTAILSGGPDIVNDTTLKRITIDKDGGFRIWQWTIGPNATSWTAMANWVVSDRPDSRSQCTSFGTCGPYGMCTSVMDSLDLVVCECPDSRFQAINNDTAQGCILPQSPSNTNCTNATMLELAGVDMPWGGDYKFLTGSEAVNCKDECMKDCSCNGAVYSSMEQKCWMKTGLMYNLGYPTVALHGNNRTAYIKMISNPSSLGPPVSKAKEWLRLVEIVVPTVVGSGLLLVALIFFLRRSEKVREDCGLCSRRTRRDNFPGEYPGSE